MKARALRLLAHAADERRVVAAELYGDFNGGRGEREAESERGDGEARESERSGRGASGVHQGERRGTGARGMEVERCSCMAATHGPRVIRWGISANTWRAMD